MRKFVQFDKIFEISSNEGFGKQSTGFPQIKYSSQICYLLKHYIFLSTHALYVVESEYFNLHKIVDLWLH